MSIRLGMTGTGYIAKIHARAARSLPDVVLTAVANHRPESMADFANQFEIPHQYPTIEAMLAGGQIDAVSINTPNARHAPEAIAALEAGVHVMVEKPMAMNATEAAAMIAASERSGALLMVAHCWRFDEETLWLKEQLDSGRIGTPIRTTGYGVHVNWGPGGWFTSQALAGGGALADMGIHAIDTVRFLMGDPQPVSVYARIGTHFKPFDVDDTGVMLIQWDNGVTSYIESGWWQPHADGPEAGTRLYGTEGYASLFPTYLSLPEPNSRASTRVDSGFPPVRDPHCPQLMYDRQLAYFIDCIQSGRTPSPGGPEGLVNMRIVDAAYESSRTGQAIMLAAEERGTGPGATMRQTANEGT